MPRINRERSGSLCWAESDEEGDEVTVTLERADGGVQGVRDACVHEGVDRVRALGGIRPAEQLTEEGPGSVRIAAGRAMSPRCVIGRS